MGASQSSTNIAMISATAEEMNPTIGNIAQRTAKTRETSRHTVTRAQIPYHLIKFFKRGQA